MSSTSVTLEDIQHLSDEVHALVAAGLPLEQNLADAGRGHGRRLRQLTEDISKRLASGEALDDIVSGESGAVSRILSSAVTAGIQSGDLATSIELVGDLAADLVDLRRRVLQAIAYPLSVALMAATLFLFTIRLFLHEMFSLLSDTGAHVPALVLWVHGADEWFPQWPWVITLAAFLVFAACWLTTQSRSIVFHGPMRWLLWLPGVGSLVRDMQFYMTTRMIHLLVERQLPLTDALSLAGACSGDAGLDQSCRREANRLRLQQPATQSRFAWKRGQLPPLLEACLAQQGGNEQLLAERLNGLAGHYQRRVLLGVAWMQHVIPGALLIIIGGGAVLTYTFSLMWPVKELYDSLSVY